MTSFIKVKTISIIMLLFDLLHCTGIGLVLTLRRNVDL